MNVYICVPCNVQKEEKNKQKKAPSELAIKESCSWLKFHPYLVSSSCSPFVQLTKSSNVVGHA